MRNRALLCATLVVACASIAAAGSDVILISNGNIVPVVGEPIEGGDILIADGKIENIGVGLTAPEGATLIDATGLSVYPGFIDGFSSFGLEEISSIGPTADSREIGKHNPDVRAAWAINPDSVHIAVSRLNGTTSAIVAPSGGTFSGQATLMRMAGWTFEEMAVEASVASLINFPTTPKPTGEAAITKQEKPKVDIATKLVERITDYLDDARRYWAIKAAVEEDPSLRPPPFNAKLEALKPVLDGDQPVILTVEKSKDIELALQFAAEQNLNVVLRGCAQGFAVADKIKAAGVPVIVDNLYTGPSDYEDGYDAAWTNVAAMAEAGIPLCFSSGSASTGKDMPYFAARAVAFGMDRDEAIRALTINPARFFGVSDRLGSLEVGKDADLFLTTGDPLQITSVVKVMVIDGKRVDLADNWWDQQQRKWDSRPAPEN
ncbi:MAG: amidohydrolase family protein [bacterium]|nr:amidohydrolase family protein [bacterium]